MRSRNNPRYFDDGTTTTATDEMKIPLVSLSSSPTDDADAAAGTGTTATSISSTATKPQHHHYSNNPTTMIIPSAPNSLSGSGMSVMTTDDGSIDFYEDLISDPVLVLGVDISHLSRGAQFVVCATGVFFFTLLYGYLQELLSVQLCSRQLGLFLAVVQFSGYTVLAYVLRTYVYRKQQQSTNKRRRRKNRSKRHQLKHSTSALSGGSSNSLSSMAESNHSTITATSTTAAATTLTTEMGSSPTRNNSNHNATSSSSSKLAMMAVPFTLYLGLSLLRAVDLACTNLAMQYINYPAKTLIKSSRIVFTMIFGVFITHKRYNVTDYAIVLCMVVGLAIFMHADATSSAVFQPLGVIMLVVSLTCDGAITNMSERIMTQYGVGQDEFIFRMYSIALVAIIGASAVNGDLIAGTAWILQPGTYEQQLNHVPLEERSWSSTGKIMTIILFSSMGFFGSSCAAAITKNFGALAMSITSTARKATTLFLSFLLFDNKCTVQHVIGIIIFISALTAKSVRRKNKRRGHHHTAYSKKVPPPRPIDIEIGGGGVGSRSSSVDSATAGDDDHQILPSSSLSGRENNRVSRRATTNTDRRNSNVHPRPRYHVV